jgi:hypothetical protein
MILINTDTNCTVGGLPVPVGSFEYPMEGNVGILTSGGVSTNFTVGSGDTLFVWRTGAAVQPGVDTFMMFSLGVGLVVSVMGLLVVARRLTSLLTAGRVKEV